jgi:tetraacyldisaccharide 4'-kinase
MDRVTAWHRRLVLEGPKSPWQWLLQSLLLPLGWLYGIIASVRVWLYRREVLSSYRAGVPVVSVGNLSVGGTGKTPMTDHLIRYFQDRGRKVAVVSRGYRGRVRDVAVVSAGDDPLLSPEICGDEPLLLARRNPGAVVLAAPRRSAGVRLAVERFGAEIIILDDGFQHLAVQRDLDIVLLDARRPMGNQRVLPAGLLREFPSALKRADLLVLTRSQGDEKFFLRHGKPLVRCRHAFDALATSLRGESIPLIHLADKKGVAFAGIADPEGFFDSLRSAGLNLVNTFSFPDHAAYDEETLLQLEKVAGEADFLVTTEKDGVKLPSDAFSLPCYQVSLRLEFFDPADMERALDSLIA